jgi:hypothetical protein
MWAFARERKSWYAWSSCGQDMGAREEAQVVGLHVVSSTNGERAEPSSLSSGRRRRPWGRIGRRSSHREGHGTSRCSGNGWSCRTGSCSASYADSGSSDRTGHCHRGSLDSGLNPRIGHCSSGRSGLESCRPACETYEAHSTTFGAAGIRICSGPIHRNHNTPHPHDRCAWDHRDRTPALVLVVGGADWVIARSVLGPMLS